MDTVVLSADDRFPLSFHYRIANQILNQAEVYRDEGDLNRLHQTLQRYSRLVSEIIPRHRSYSTCSSKDKLHHNKILQKVAKELEGVKPVLERTSNETAGKFKQSKDGSHRTQRLNMKDQAVAGHNVEKGAMVLPRLVGNFVPLRTSKVSCSNATDTKGCRYNTAARDNTIDVRVVEHHFPSPVLSCVENLPLVGHVSHITTPESTNDNPEASFEGSSTYKALQDVHISARLMEEFMELASANTEKNLETCGILGAFLKNQTFYVTTLIIPKQESTSNSCQASNEEEIHAIQDGQSLFPVGWIHTHPSQTCFLSSVDLHTQYSYQVMLPEAIAIVMAPTDPTRSYGIFRLTDSGGIAVIKECREDGGFHLHPETCPDGSPIYESCSNVYINPNLRFEVIDLRFAPYP